MIATILNFRIEAPYFKALNSAPIPILVACDDGRFLMVKPIAFEAATGFSHEDIPTVASWIEHLHTECGP